MKQQNKNRNTVFRFFNVVIYPEKYQKEENYDLAFQKIYD